MLPEGLIKLNFFIPGMIQKSDYAKEANFELGEANVEAAQLERLVGCTNV